VPLQIHVQTLKTDPGQAFKEFLKAIDILEGETPTSADNCPFCSWHERLKELKI